MTTKQRSVVDLESVVLKHGSHRGPSEGMCVMEAVAYFANEKFTDHPACVSPAIGAFMRSWNDSLKDEPRQRLKPYVLKVMATNTGAADEERRAWMATDWLTRTFAPAWLDLAGLKDHAAALRALPELSTTELAEAAQSTIESARSAAAAAGAAAGAAARAAARDAAGAAAGAAARDAARAAARDAARDAAWDAAWAAARDAARAAAWAAARDAARDAAWAAARDAARAAAWDALQPTVVALQESAFELLDRMIAVGKTEPAQEVAA